MKLPSKIKYGYREFEVKQVLSSEIGGTYACFSDWEGNINIAVDRNKDHQHYTSDLIHELVEMINSRRELRLEHWKIQSLAEDLTELLLRNELVEPIEL